MKMLAVYYRYSGCDDLRYFKSKEEIEEWIPRAKQINPDIVIVKIEEEEIGWRK